MEKQIEEFKNSSPLKKDNKILLDRIVKEEYNKRKENGYTSPNNERKVVTIRKEIKTVVVMKEDYN